MGRDDGCDFGWKFQQENAAAVTLKTEDPFPLPEKIILSDHAHSFRRKFTWRRERGRSLSQPDPP